MKRKAAGGGRRAAVAAPAPPYPAASPEGAEDSQTLSQHSYVPEDTSVYDPRLTTRECGGRRSRAAEGDRDPDYVEEDGDSHRARQRPRVDHNAGPSVGGGRGGRRSTRGRGGGGGGGGGRSGAARVNVGTANQGATESVATAAGDGAQAQAVPRGFSPFEDGGISTSHTHFVMANSGRTAQHVVPPRHEEYRSASPYNNRNGNSSSGSNGNNSNQNRNNGSLPRSAPGAAYHAPAPQEPQGYYDPYGRFHTSQSGTQASSRRGSFSNGPQAANGSAGVGVSVGYAVDPNLLDPPPQPHSHAGSGGSSTHLAFDFNAPLEGEIGEIEVDASQTGATAAAVAAAAAVAGESGESGRKPKRKHKPAPPRTARACNPCRKQKMRCNGADSPPCARCVNLGLNCEFERRVDYVINREDSLWQRSADDRLAALYDSVELIGSALVDRFGPGVWDTWLDGVGLGGDRHKGKGVEGMPHRIRWHEEKRPAVGGPSSGFQDAPPAPEDPKLHALVTAPGAASQPVPPPIQALNATTRAQRQAEQRQQQLLHYGRSHVQEQEAAMAPPPTQMQRLPEAPAPVPVPVPIPGHSAQEGFVVQPSHQRAGQDDGFVAQPPPRRSQLDRNDGFVVQPAHQRSLLTSEEGFVVQPSQHRGVQEPSDGFVVQPRAPAPRGGRTQEAQDRVPQQGYSQRMEFEATPGRPLPSRVGQKSIPGTPQPSMFGIGGRAPPQEPQVSARPASAPVPPSQVDQHAINHATPSADALAGEGAEVELPEITDPLTMPFSRFWETFVGKHAPAERERLPQVEGIAEDEGNPMVDLKAALPDMLRSWVSHFPSAFSGPWVASANLDAAPPFVRAVVMLLASYMHPSDQAKGLFPELLAAAEAEFRKFKWSNDQLLDATTREGFDNIVAACIASLWFQPPIGGTRFLLPRHTYQLLQTAPLIFAGDEFFTESATDTSTPDESDDAPTSAQRYRLFLYLLLTLRSFATYTTLSPALQECGGMNYAKLLETERREEGDVYLVAALELLRRSWCTVVRSLRELSDAKRYKPHDRIMDRAAGAVLEGCEAGKQGLAPYLEPLHGKLGESQVWAFAFSALYTLASSFQAIAGFVDATRWFNEGGPTELRNYEDLARFNNTMSNELTGSHCQSYRAHLAKAPVLLQRAPWAMAAFTVRLGRAIENNPSLGPLYNPSVKYGLPSVEDSYGPVAMIADDLKGAGLGPEHPMTQLSDKIMGLYDDAVALHHLNVQSRAARRRSKTADPGHQQLPPIQLPPSNRRKSGSEIPSPTRRLSATGMPVPGPSDRNTIAIPPTAGGHSHQRRHSSTVALPQPQAGGVRLNRAMFAPDPHLSGVPFSSPEFSYTPGATSTPSDTPGSLRGPHQRRATQPAQVGLGIYGEESAISGPHQQPQWQLAPEAGPDQRRGPPKPVPQALPEETQFYGYDYPPPGHPASADGSGPPTFGFDQMVDVSPSASNSGQPLSARPGDGLATHIPRPQSRANSFVDDAALAQALSRPMSAASGAGLPQAELHVAPTGGVAHAHPPGDGLTREGSAALEELLDPQMMDGYTSSGFV